MTPQEQLNEYIQKSKAVGKSENDIKQELITAGWQPDIVDTAFRDGVEGSPASAQEYAGFWHRVAAAIVDGLLLGIVFIVLAGVFAFLGVMGGVPTNGFFVVLVNLLQLVVWFFYYPYMEAKHGATWGKQFIGVKVVRDGSSELLSLGRSTGRSAAKILSAIIFGIGFLMAAFTKKKQGLHDKMTEAVVIKTPRVNKYRTILTIVLGTITPFLFMIFVMPLIMTAMLGLLFTGAFTGTGDIDMLDTEYPSIDYTAPIPAVASFTSAEMDMLLATTSIGALLESEPALFAEGYTSLGPALVAWNPDYYDVLSIYVPDFEFLNEDEIIEVEVTDVKDASGTSVLDRSVADEPISVRFKSYSAGDSFVFVNDVQKAFPLSPGVSGEVVKTVSGVVRFKVPLESGEQYERSYDFVLDHKEVTQ